MIACIQVSPVCLDTAIPMNLVQPGGATSTGTVVVSSGSITSTGRSQITASGQHHVENLTSRHLQQRGTSPSNGHLGAAVLEDMEVVQSAVAAVGNSSVGRYRHVIQQLHPSAASHQLPAVQTNNVLMSATSAALYSATSINGFDAGNFNDLISNETLSFL